jgi:hypothetical protein
MESRSMRRRMRLTVGIVLGLLPTGILPISCVDTSRPNRDATGGRSAAHSGGAGGEDATATGGILADGIVVNSCGDEIDTATDGTAGTTSIGPYLWKSVAIRGGGFVDGIVFSPVEKDLVYARTDMGGAYRWEPAMTGWVALTDWVSRSINNQIGIESIAADPIDANVVYLAAGTYPTAGNGVILRSIDRGATFAKQDIGVRMGGNSDGRSMGERLAIDPNLTSTLYFGSRAAGLMRSVDSGGTWTNVSSFPTLGGMTANGTPLGLSFVLVDPKSGVPGSGSSTIYVGVADVAQGNNLAVSTDAGTTWQSPGGGPTQQMPHHAALDGSGALYLAYDNGPGPNDITAGAIWKYEPAKRLWSDVTPNRGGYGYGGVAVDAAHPGTVVASTLDWWNPDEIYRTTDGGISWIAVGRNARHNPNGAEWLRWGRGGCAAPSFSGWMGDIEIDPFDSNHVMYVTGQGVWTSRNLNSTTVSKIVWTFEDRNLEQTAVIDMVASVHGAFLSCVGDIAGMRHDNLEQPSPTGMYSNPKFGNCSSLDFAGLNPDVVVRSGTLDSAKPGGGHSTDNGRTWKPFPTLPPNAVSTGDGGRVAVSADGTTVIWTLPNSPPAYSTDGGVSWSAVVGLAPGARVVADRQNPGKFYAYLYAGSVGTVYASSDSGKTFATATNGVSFKARGHLVAAFGREGDLWLVTNDTLYHSSSSGENFAAVSGVKNAYALGFGSAATAGSYPAIYLYGTVGSTTGLYRSDDQALTFTLISDDAHQFGTAVAVAGDETIYGRVYVGTNGRGVIYGDPSQ